MTREDFVDWTRLHKCEPDPIEGINVTAWSIRFVNTTNRKLYTYISTPIDNRDMPNHLIRLACIQLGIPIPDNL
jgi:hypothetical protein